MIDKIATKKTPILAVRYRRESRKTAKPHRDKAGRARVWSGSRACTHVHVAAASVVLASRVARLRRRLMAAAASRTTAAAAKVVSAGGCQVCFPVSERRLRVGGLAASVDAPAMGRLVVRRAQRVCFLSWSAVLAC